MSDMADKPKPGGALEKLWRYAETELKYDGTRWVADATRRSFRPISPRGNKLVLAALRELAPVGGYRPWDNHGAPREMRAYRGCGIEAVVTFHSRGLHQGRRYVESVVLERSEGTGGDGDD